VDVTDAPTAFLLASTPALSDVANPPLRNASETIRPADSCCESRRHPKAEHPALVQRVVGRDGNGFAGKLNYVPGRTCANSKNACERSVAEDGSLAFTVVRGRPPSAIVS
jgi:hypothetical protein